MEESSVGSQRSLAKLHPASVFCVLSFFFLSDKHQKKEHCSLLRLACPGFLFQLSIYLFFHWEKYISGLRRDYSRVLQTHPHRSNLRLFVASHQWGSPIIYCPGTGKPALNPAQCRKQQETALGWGIFPPCPGRGPRIRSDGKGCSHTCTSPAKFHPPTPPRKCATLASSKRNVCWCCVAASSTYVESSVADSIGLLPALEVPYSTFCYGSTGGTLVLPVLWGSGLGPKPLHCGL